MALAERRPSHCRVAGSERNALVLAVSLALSGCASEPTGSGASFVVYGMDDRIDLWAASSLDLQTLASASAVACVAPRALRFSGADASSSNPITIRAPPLSAWDTYCPGTPFLDQPTAATCGAILIDDDLVLTAGHCLTSVPTCRDFNYVFSYAYNTPTMLGPITRDDIFACRQVALTTVSPPDSTEQLDFAFIELDRPATAPRAPALLGAPGPRIPGEPLTVIGFPSGLPVKIDTGAVVVDARPSSLDNFTLTSDTFSGSSGSGVYDASNALVGVFARGTTDFVDEGACRKERTLSGDAAISGESATYVRRAVDALCASGWPSNRLCGLAPRCGDGICSTTVENATTCPADCPAPTCGDALCETSEWQTCPADCGDRRPASLPDTWTCEPSWYGDGRTCDCNCGAPDSDCDAPGGATRACDSFGPGGVRAAAHPLEPVASGGCTISRRCSVPPDTSTHVAITLVLLAALRRARTKSSLKPRTEKPLAPQFGVGSSDR